MKEKNKRFKELLPLLILGILGFGLYFVYYIFLGYAEADLAPGQEELQRRSLKAAVFTAINILPWVVYYYYQKWKKSKGDR